MMMRGFKVLFARSNSERKNCFGKELISPLLQKAKDEEVEICVPLLVKAEKVEDVTAVKKQEQAPKLKNKDPLKAFRRAQGKVSPFRVP